MMKHAPSFIPDYLLIGHIAHDVTPHGPQLGGTVSYGAHTAAAFGLKVAVLTSTQRDEPLLGHLPPTAVVQSVPAAHTTMFENRYEGSTRTQFMYHRALTLTPAMLPDTWRKARLVHFAPIAYEVDPSFVDVFDHARICVTPQGWMRERESDGRVRTVHWPDAARVLPPSSITVMSEEDIRHDPGLETVFAQLAPLLIVTRAERGGIVYQDARPAQFAAHLVETQVDPTGAGDIFATALHIALAELGDLVCALSVATYVAGMSVMRSGFAGAPTPQEVAEAWRVAAELLPK